VLEEDVQARVHPGLPGRDYYAQDVWELERETLFTNSWFCISWRSGTALADTPPRHEIPRIVIRPTS
jgi:hypothetical protein